MTSFAQAAEQHLDDVYGYLVWFTGDRFLAEDLANETFERALRLWHRFDPKRGSLSLWLGGIVIWVGMACGGVAALVAAPALTAFVRVRLVPVPTSWESSLRAYPEGYAPPP